MTIKTFRGLMADGAQERIVLHTNNGLTGYRIVKLEIMHAEPGQQDAEHTVKVFTVPQTTVTNAIDFSDQTLIGAAYLTDDNTTLGAASTVIIFDNKIFNQDIYITHEDTGGSQPCNYHIELEEIKLDLSESTVASLKDIRNVYSQITT